MAEKWVNPLPDAGWLRTSYPHPDKLPPDRWERLQLTRDAYLAYYESMEQERALRDRAAPIVGDHAPNFEIDRLSLGGKRTGAKFSLSSTRGRPVALVFGSYT